MHDWSEAVSPLPKRAAQLSDALSLKQYFKAMKLASGIAVDMSKIMLWIGRESFNKGRK